jgi:hypothetical protein
LRHATSFDEASKTPNVTCGGAQSDSENQHRATRLKQPQLRPTFDYIDTVNEHP